MIALPAIPEDASAADALALLDRAGWRCIGTGDWSWVLTDASGDRAARVSPFDPAYRMHAEACLTGPRNRWLPHMTAIIPLRRDGYVVMTERLYPADEKAASELCAALAIGSDAAADVPSPGRLRDVAADAEFDALRVRLLALLADGARRFRLWGGADIRPGNVMADAQGQLKLIDPIFLRGRAIVDALLEGRLDLLTDFSRGQLEDFLTIPVFRPGSETDDLRSRLASLYEQQPASRSS